MCDSVLTQVGAAIPKPPALGVCLNSVGVQTVLDRVVGTHTSPVSGGKRTTHQRAEGELGILTVPLTLEFSESVASGECLPLAPESRHTKCQRVVR